MGVQNKWEGWKILSNLLNGGGGRSKQTRWLEFLKKSVNISNE